MNQFNQELIGTLAAILTTTSFVPQVVRTVKTRDTRAISVWMYLLFCTGVALWGVYGLLLASWPIILANGVTLALGLVILQQKVADQVALRRARRPRVAEARPARKA